MANAATKNPTAPAAPKARPGLTLGQVHCGGSRLSAHRPAAFATLYQDLHRLGSIDSIQRTRSAN
jgi:hypothetical protein